MKKALIIVESPAKIKTLKKFLGPKYAFESSIGHIRDLPKKGFGIDVEHDFEPEYKTLDEKKEVIQKLKKAAKESEIVYLSPDPDREGEAIAWHIASILPPGTKYQRVTFNSITKEAVLEALKHPRDIDQALVDAQQARRLLDRIVGYKISPILTRRVRGAKAGALSAGRVQSVALKLIVDREKAIDAFVPVEYWNLFAHLQANKKEKPFTAHLYSVKGKKVEKEPVTGKDVFLISNGKTAEELVRELKKATYTVSDVERKEKKRNPTPPFITSTLQQEASRHFGFSATRTMSVAQSLYEGVDLGADGTEGLITYMRTDSVRLAPEAISAMREFIGKTFGKAYVPDEPRHYTTKKSAQDAHEAIRPTSLLFTPSSIQKHLTADQFKLYSLIWKRSIASQMNPAVYDTLTCTIDTNKEMVLRATGSVIKFQGFLAIYEEKQDEEGGEEGENTRLPNLEVGEKLQLLDLKSEQSFTKPPPRFTEASLVKELEKSGVGRPSTYAATMQKIQSRDYTLKEKGTLKPTELGKVIAQMLETNFQLIMDIGFTATMEDNLELVAENKIPWKTLISEFWKEFIPTVLIAEKEAFVPKEETDLPCPECGGKIQKIWARGKYFHGCANYPECKYTAPLEALDFDKSAYQEDFDWEQKCPKCEGEMQLRFGRFGPFLGCKGYPECKGIVNIPKKGEPSPEDMPNCVAIGCDGKIVQRRSRFGKPFFSCSNYPDCDVIVSSVEGLKAKYPNHPKTAYVKQPRKGKGGGGGGRAYKLSKELEAIVGAKELSRPEVTKKVWEYIKAHKLQDSKNRRQINPDAKLAKVFGGKEGLDMMQLARVLGPHLS